MARRIKAGPGYEEKEKYRKRQHNAYRRSFSGKITNIMTSVIFAGLVVAAWAIVWIFKQIWVTAKMGFVLIWQGILWIVDKLKAKLEKDKVV